MLDSYIIMVQVRGLAGVTVLYIFSRQDVTQSQCLTAPMSIKGT